MSKAAVHGTDTTGCRIKCAFINIDNFSTPGDGQSRSSRTFGASAESKVLTNEMEYVREIFSSRALVVLHDIFDIRHAVLVSADGPQLRDDTAALQRFQQHERRVTVDRRQRGKFEIIVILYRSNDVL